MNRKRQRICLFLALLLSTWAVQNQGICDEDTPNFYETVTQRFQKWDKDKDGKLNSDEIVSAFQNPNCRGAPAAAITVLQQLETRHLIKKEPIESFTLEDINRMAAEARPGHDKNQKKFESNLKKIQSKSTVLFAHDLPQIDDIRQGGANDCYFLSVVAALARQRPKDLQNLIETNPDRGYTVHFFGQEPVKVYAITDGEVAAYNSTQDGLWLPVLIKAYGKLSLKQKWRDEKYTPIHEDAVQAVAIHGGNTGSIVKLFTGHEVKAEKPQEIASNVRRRLTKAFNDHRMVLVGVPGHAMALMKYEAKSDQIEIWNPWGTSGRYKELDVQMQHGFFELPMSDFIAKCTHVVFELDENAPVSSINSNDSKTNGGHKQRRS